MISKSVLRDAWWLARKDFGNHWLSLIWNTLFNLYMVWMLLLPMTYSQQQDDMQGAALIINGVTMNFFVLAIIPMWGFPISKAFMNYKKTDLYTKKIAYLKTLPISNQVIIWSRFIQTAMLVMAMASVVFIPYFTILDYSGKLPLSFLECVAFTLVWAGFSLLIGSFYISWELGMPGKAYFIRCLLIMPLFAIGAYVFWWLFGQSLWLVMMEWIHDFQFLLPIGALLISFLSIVAVASWLEKRLEKRDLHG